MTVLLENLHSQLLVDHVILGDEYAVDDVVLCDGGGDGVRLEGGDQRRHQVGNLYGSCDLGRDTVVETPFDCNVP